MPGLILSLKSACGWVSLIGLIKCAELLIDDGDLRGEIGKKNQMLVLFGLLMSDMAGASGFTYVIKGKDGQPASAQLRTSVFPSCPVSFVYVPTSWARLVLSLLKLGVLRVSARPATAEPQQKLVAVFLGGKREWLIREEKNWGWKVEKQGT